MMSMVRGSGGGGVSDQRHTTQQYRAASFTGSSMSICALLLFSFVALTSNQQENENGVSVNVPELELCY